MAKVEPQIPQGEFILEPSKIRDDKIVPNGEELLVLTLKEFLEGMRATGHREERVKLRQARTGGFIGFSIGPRTKQLCLFVIWRPDRGNDIEFLLRRDRGFPERCQKIFRIVKADWGSRMAEPFSGKKDTPTWKAIPGAGSTMMERA